MHISSGEQSQIPQPPRKFECLHLEEGLSHQVIINFLRSGKMKDFEIIQEPTKRSWELKIKIDDTRVNLIDEIKGGMNDYILKDEKGNFKIVSSDYFKRNFSVISEKGYYEIASEKGDLSLECPKQIHPDGWKAAYYKIAELFNHEIETRKTLVEPRRDASSQLTWVEGYNAGYSIASAALKSLNQNKKEEHIKSYSYPLFHKELNIGDKFRAKCTETGQEVDFAVIGYDRLRAKINLAILSPTFPVKWIIQDNEYPSMIVDLWDKCLEILEYKI